MQHCHLWVDKGIRFKKPILLALYTNNKDAVRRHDQCLIAFTVEVGPLLKSTVATTCLNCCDMNRQHNVLKEVDFSKDIDVCSRSLYIVILMSNI